MNYGITYYDKAIEATKAAALAEYGIPQKCAVDGCVRQSDSLSVATSREQAVVSIRLCGGHGSEMFPHSSAAIDCSDSSSPA